MQPGSQLSYTPFLKGRSFADHSVTRDNNL